MGTKKTSASAKNFNIAFRVVAEFSIPVQAESLADAIERAASFGIHDVLAKYPDGDGDLWDGKVRLIGAYEKTDVLPLP